MLENDLVLYNPGYTKEIGIVKRINNDTAFVKYNFGETYPATSISDLKVISEEEAKNILNSLNNKEFASTLI